MLVKLLSIEEAFQWAQRIAVREWRLLLPVAFALLALPPLMMDLLLPQSYWAALNVAVQTNNPELAATAVERVFPVMLVVIVILTLGGLAITALALVPAISVREALSLALRRLGVMIASVLLLGVAQAILGILVGVVFALLHMAVPLPPSLLLVMLVVVGVVAGTRLSMLAPMIVTRRVGPLAALRESWTITQGHFWKILGAILIYFVGAFVVLLALVTGVGAIFVLAAKAAAMPELGVALLAVFQRAIGAVIGVGFHLLVAGIFRQLNDGSIRAI